jgi:two-component system LytT family response regulator
MVHLEEKLDPEMFLRVHRSSIVNLQYVKEVRTEKDGELTVLVSNGQKIPMSRGYRSRLQGLLQR